MLELRDVKFVIFRVMCLIEVKMKEIFGFYCGWVYNVFFIVEFKYVRDVLFVEFCMLKCVVIFRSTSKSKLNASKSFFKIVCEVVVGVDVELDVVFDILKKFKIDF